MKVIGDMQTTHANPPADVKQSQVKRAQACSYGEHPQFDDIVFNIQGKRYVSIGTFHGSVYVKLRDYNFCKDEKCWECTTSGMNLTKKQWERLKSLIQAIDLGIQNVEAM